MNIQKFTQKSISAVQNAESKAKELNNQQLLPVHMLWALLDDKEGLIPSILTSMQINVSALENAVNAEISSLPSVTSSSGSELYLSSSLNDILEKAEKISEKMGDEYVSVEHIMQSLIENADASVSGLFSSYGVTKDKFLTALKSQKKESSTEP